MCRGKKGKRTEKKVAANGGFNLDLTCICVRPFVMRYMIQVPSVNGKLF